MPNPDIARFASQGGKARAKHRLTLARVQAELPPLESPETAKQRLAIISNLGLAGQLSASMVGAQERVHREWREQHAFEIDRQRMRALEQRVKELESELAQRPANLRRAL
jgi:hypothetical protein